MVTITAPAYVRLAGRRTRQANGLGCRVTVTNGHVQFRADQPQHGDLVFEHEGQSVLMISSSTATLLTSHVLDVVTTDVGDRLRFVRQA